MKKIIAGFGISGEGAALLCRKLGFSVLIVEERDTEELRKKAASFAGSCVEVLLGWKENMPLPRAEEILLSPGIRKDSPLYQALEKTGAGMVGEMEFALRHIPCPFCAITGTNGKTTTTEMTCAILRGIGLRAESSGNIGKSISCCVLEALEGKINFLVVEVSSFQLESMKEFPACPAAILNLASDHLDRHKSMEEYAGIKFKLIRSSREEERILHSSLIPWKEKFLGPGSAVFFSAEEKTALFHCEGEKLYCGEKLLFDFRKSNLKGLHNKENMLAALALARAAAGEEAMSHKGVAAALEAFAPSPHRMEVFAERNGICYINDSKATNPHAVLACCRVFGDEKRANLVLLMGGLDKDMDFGELVPILPMVKKIFLFGSCREKLAQSLKNSGVPLHSCGSFEESVEEGMKCAVENGDCLLLSPATASMDLFRNYMERGETFKRLVLAALSGKN